MCKCSSAVAVLTTPAQVGLVQVFHSHSLRAQNLNQSPQFWCHKTYEKTCRCKRDLLGIGDPIPLPSPELALWSCLAGSTCSIQIGGMKPHSFSLFRDWSFAMCSFFFLCLPLAPKCGHTAMIRMGGTSYGRAQLRCFSASLWNLSWCDFWPPWTHAKARAQTLDERPRLLRPERLVFIQDQGYTPCPGSYAARVAIAQQDKWRKHSLQHRLLAIYAFLASWQAC